MFRFKVHKLLALLFLTLTAGNFARAFPMYQRTTLPVPPDIIESEKDMIREVLQLEVYQDSADSNQYYFVPPFHIRQYTRGATSMMLHAEKIKHYAKAMKIRHDIEAYSEKEIQRLVAEVNEKAAALKESKKQLFEAMPSGNQGLIDLCKDFVEFSAEEYAVAVKELAEARRVLEEAGTLMSTPMVREKNRHIVNVINLAGFPFTLKPNTSIEEMNVEINEGMRMVENSYGGFLSVNAYGGFSKKQLDVLQTYLSRYYPRLKVSLLPIEKMSFFALTEYQKEVGNVTAGNTMFRNVNGSGDYLGTALVMDATVTGALGIAEHMGPFILPLGIKGMFLRQAPETHAMLDCNFKSGYRVQGRADVRDGLVIFDNDITNRMQGNDESVGGCKIQHFKGDLAVAKHYGLQALSEALEGMHFSRTLLAGEEKQRYLAGVHEDIQANRRSASSSRYAHWLDYLNPFNAVGLAAEAIRNVADFHWHTNIQNVSNLSNFSFKKQIYVNGHTQFEKDLPTNLCLVFNPEYKAYDRCTPKQAETARTMGKSIDEIAESPECKELTDPFECGRKRDEAGIFAPENYTFDRDDYMINSLSGL